MWFVRAGRAWLLSVLSCAAFLALWVVAMHALNGRVEYMWHNMLDVSVGFGSVFALTAALVYVPVFSLLGVALRQPLPRTGAAIIGCALAPAAHFAVAWRFRESEDPQTVQGMILYLATHIPESIVGILPFVMAGALFGWLWTWRDNSRKLSGRGCLPAQTALSFPRKSQ